MVKVSVTIPAYNYANYLPSAIQSVLNQSYPDFELLIVDDGSTDNTSEVIRGFLHNPKVRHVYQENQGLAAARNTGIRNTHGELVAFLDADDEWLEEKLERQVEVMDSKPQVGLVYTDVYFISEQGESLLDRRWAPRTKETMFEDLLFNNVVTGSASSSIVRRACLDRVGVFDETLRSLEDLDLWLRIAACFEFQRVDQPLTKIRHHQSNIQLDVDRMAEGWLAHLAKREVPAEYRAADRLARYEILARIAGQYYQLGRMRKYRQYALMAVGKRRRHVLDPRFWRCFVASYLGLEAGGKQNWVTRTLRN